MRMVLNLTANPIYQIGYGLLGMLRSLRRIQMAKTIVVGAVNRKAPKTHLSSFGKRGFSCWSAGLLNGANIVPVKAHRNKLVSNNSASAHLGDVLKFVSLGAATKFASLSEDDRKTIVKRRARALRLANLVAKREGLQHATVAGGSIGSNASSKSQTVKSYAG